MGSIDTKTLNAAKKYADKLIRGEGAIQGKDGKDGRNGKSAYEVAVENGYEGTEAEWLETLKGGADPSDIDWSTPNAEDEEPSEISDIDW